MPDRYHMRPASRLAAANIDRVHPLAPVVAFDIDGTLGDYYNHFLWFCELYLQRKIDVHWSFGQETEFSDALGLDKATYRQIKLAYRQGGMKRSLPMYLGADRLVSLARMDLGLRVYITTTRPWNRLDNIDPDTMFWINRNLGRVDGVIYGEDKYHDLLDIVGAENVLGVIDDLPENIIRARELGLPAMLRLGDHNRWWQPDQTTYASTNCNGMADWVLQLAGERVR